MAEILITAPGSRNDPEIRPNAARAGPADGRRPHRAIPEHDRAERILPGARPVDSDRGPRLDLKTAPASRRRTGPADKHVFAHAFTDAQGRYRIEALPGDNDLEIIPPKGSRYLPGGVTVKTAAGSQRVVRDIVLAAGILVHGQAIDERTHQPVSGIVQYFAFEPNPHLANTDSLHPLITWNKVPADAEGRFEIAALPGPGILGFEARFKRCRDFHTASARSDSGSAAIRMAGSNNSEPCRTPVVRTVSISSYR